ncbi:jerky protein homolog [Anneissia japonica]|uniref:jerky protein homolog n=1 Tax=Anneissia japonica TaxID=1529436 RepID=UPI001425888D|nr:jerky protein homolog [Anneissia japonica]
MYTWMEQQRSKGVFVKGPLLSEKAFFFAEQFYPGQNFLASCGWLDNFKARHGIRWTTLQGESQSADVNSIDPFKSKLEGIIEENQLTRDQVFNGDETGLWWRLMPNRSHNLMEIIKCGCKTGCNQGRCQCNKMNMKCSDLCQCTNCQNRDDKDTMNEDAQFADDEYLDKMYIDDLFD